MRSRRRGRWFQVLVLGTFLACAATGANSGNTGSVTGTVVDDSGHAVNGARVLISHAPSIKAPMPAPPVITGPLAAMVTADARGSFQTDGLAPGQYIACAETTAPGLLDPCHWAASAPNFTVSAGQTISGVSIVMAKGAVVRIHINDPQRLLKPVAGVADFDFQIHVVTGKGIHYSAPIQLSNPGGRDHAITIPFSTAVRLQVFAAHLNVNDNSGKPFARTGTDVSTPAAGDPAVIVLNIAGRQ
jgi:hypothetical protein